MFQTKHSRVEHDRLSSNYQEHNLQSQTQTPYTQKKRQRGITTLRESLITKPDKHTHIHARVHAPTHKQTHTYTCTHVM